MTELGEATIPIRATLDKLDGDLSNARGMVARALGGIGSIAAVGIGAGVAAVAGLGAAFGAVVVPATQAAARTSELGAVLGLLGQRAGWSAAEVEANTQAMRDLGIRTDVAQGMLAQFARYQLDAADATRIARVAQDAAVLSMSDSSEALDNIMHGILTQNTEVLRNAGLNIQASQALDAYAESVGKTTAELTATERIQAMLNAVMEEGEVIAGTYETAMEEPGKALRSLSRHFYEAQLAIGEHFLPVMGRIVDIASDAAKGLRTLLEDGQPLGDFFAESGRLAGNLVETLGTLAGLAFPNLGLDSLTGALDGVTEPLGRVNDFLETFNSRIGMGWEPLDALTSAVMALTGSAEQANAFRAAIDGIIEKIEWFKGASLQDILLSIFPPETVAGIMTVFTVAQEVIGAFVDVIVGQVWPALQESFAEIGAAFSDLGITWQDVGQVLMAVGIVIGAVIMAAIGIIVGVINGLANAIGPFVTMFVQVFGHLRTVIQGWVTFFSEGFQAIKALLQGDFPGALEHAKAAFAGLVSTITGMAQAIWAIISGVFNTVVAFVGGFVEGIVGFFTNLHQRLVGGSIIPEMLQAILAAFTGKLAEVLTVVNTWIGNVINAIQSRVSSFVQLGRDLIEGLKQGVLEFAGRLVTAVSGAVGDAIQAARNLLGIGSPSRLFWGYGENLMEGMALGLTHSADMAAAAMRSAMTGVTQAAIPVSAGAGPALLAGAAGGGQPMTIEATFVLDGREIGRAAWTGTKDAAAAEGIVLEARLA